MVEGVGTQPDTIIVRYYENRFTGGACEYNEVRFFVDEGTLFRQANSASAEAAVQSVTDLQVSSWLNKANSEFNVPVESSGLGRPAPKNLAGLGLRVEFTNSEGETDSEVVTIGLRNPQCLDVLDCF